MPASDRTPPAPIGHDQDRWPWLLVAVAVAFNAVLLAPELASDVPSRNDSALHLLMVHAASDALASGANPLDVWIPELELGYPQFLYYQHLPHLLIAVLHRLLLGSVSIEALFHGIQYLLLVLVPVTVAWSMRRMGFTPAAAAVGAAAVSLFAARERFGFEYGSYLWSGFGLHTQLWGMHLSFVALAGLVRTLRDGRGHVSTAVALAALALSHLLYAFLMAVSSVVILLAGATRGTLWARAVRLGVVGTIAVALASYLLVPFAQSSGTWLSTMPWISDGAYRPASMARTLVRGNLLDASRLPVLSLLMALGLVAALVRRAPLPRIVLAGTLWWLMLYIGRPATGPLADLLPSHQGFVSFRLAGAVGLFAVLAIGMGGEWLWGQLQRVPMVPARWRPALAVAVLLAVLSPALVERARAHRQNGREIADTRAALAADTDLQAVLMFVDGNRGGRVYAGARIGWGNTMTVGPTLRVNDLVNARRIPAYGNPYQGFALHSGLLFGIPDSSAALFDLFDIRTVIAPANAVVPPFFQPVVTAGRYAVHRVATSGAAHYVAVDARRATDDQGTLYREQVQWIRSGAPAERRVVRWDYAVPAGPPAPRPRCPDGGRTLQEVVEPHRIALVVDCPVATDTLAVALKMTFHPQWRAWVDGQATTPYMVSPGFLAVDVPPGEHRIDLRYVAHRAKLPLLALGLVVLALAAWFRGALDRPAAWVGGPRSR